MSTFLPIARCNRALVTAQSAPIPPGLVAAEARLVPSSSHEWCPPPAASLRSVVQILDGFQPDEYARDPIDPAIIAVLKDEQAAAPSNRPQLSDLAYRRQVDDATLLKVL